MFTCISFFILLFLNEFIISITTVILYLLIKTHFYYFITAAPAPAQTDAPVQPQADDIDVDSLLSQLGIEEKPQARRPGIF